MDDGQSDITLGDGVEWVSLGEAARHLGVTRAAVYGRIGRHTLATRPKGDRGLKVLWPPPQRHPDRNGDSTATITDDVTAPPDDMRECLARAEGDVARLRQQIADLLSERDHIMEQQAQARERAAKAEGEANVLRDALADLRALSDWGR